MLKPRVEDLLNQQIVKELYSANLYLSMSSYWSDKHLDGFANWYWIQYKEELDHAHIFFKYIERAGGRAKIGAIDEPTQDWKKPEDVLKQGLEHEQYVTGLIYALANAATEENDLKTFELLQWYIKEQVEEEDNASSLLGRYQNFGTDPMGLYKLDEEMAARIYTPTVKLAEYGI